MSASFLLMLVVVCPCCYVLGALIGYRRGRDDAEHDLAVSLRTHASTAPRHASPLGGRLDAQ